MRSATRQGCFVERIAGACPVSRGWPDSCLYLRQSPLWQGSRAHRCGWRNPLFRLQLRLTARPLAALAVCGSAAFMGGPAGVPVLAASLPVPVPTVAEYQFLSAGTTPPTEPECFAAGRRCFTAAAMENSYNLAPLYTAGDKGQVVTIAIIDSFGNPNMASDLANFNTQMNLPHMCGEPGQACGAGAPTFQHVFWNGKTEVKSPPPNSKDPGLQTRNAWALETSLDVEWAHAIAPMANILNVTTNPAETQGVQGFPTMRFRPVPVPAPWFTTPLPVTRRAVWAAAGARAAPAGTSSAGRPARLRSFPGWSRSPTRSPATAWARSIRRCTSSRPARTTPRTSTT